MKPEYYIYIHPLFQWLFSLYKSRVTWRLMNLRAIHHYTDVRTTQLWRISATVCIIFRENILINFCLSYNTPQALKVYYVQSCSRRKLVLSDTLRLKRQSWPCRNNSKFILPPSNWGGKDLFENFHSPHLSLSIYIYIQGVSKKRSLGIFVP